MTHLQQSTDEFYMEKALVLAAKALGRTSPNPLVGCVIVRDGAIIGEGYHQKAGTPHAEIHALKAAGALAQDATMYVTLEPCSHYGRTPPCVDAVIDSGIRRVVIAMSDPNPLVSGNGIKKLREAGIQADIGILSDKARHLNEAFIKSITTGLPFVTYKTAVTMDGKIATSTGDSRWVSSEQSRRIVQQYRNDMDVIMVGSKTVIQDDPQLTCRLPDGRDPVRVIVDGKLQISEAAKVLASSPSSPCIIATTSAASAGKIAAMRKLPHVEIWQYDAQRHVPLPQLLGDLVKRGWTSVLLEGGGALAGKLIQEYLVDKLEFFIAPKIIGGNGPSPLSGLDIHSMSQAIPLHNVTVAMVDKDVHISAYLRKPSQGAVLE